MIAPRYAPVWHPLCKHSNGFLRPSGVRQRRISQCTGAHLAWIVHFRDPIAMQVSKSNKLANVCYDI
ncbi:hypothetical protein, partial [Pseudomonas helleri]|uniref:hypothetical protein n=1 Tax=Pseudomonas helleri TaxID=1608996 RepID=UPI00243008C4